MPHQKNRNILSSKRKLICNADDYGYSEKVSEGIRTTHHEGIVQSTSVMANLVSQQALSALRDECPDIGVGAHLVMSAGHPLRSPSMVQSLVQSNGKFFALHDFLQIINAISLTELEDEWRVQIDSLLNQGIQLTHLDSHHHVAFASVTIFAVFLKLAQVYQLAVRFPSRETLQYILPSTMTANDLEAQYQCYQKMLRESGVCHPDHLMIGFYDANASVAYLDKLLYQLPNGISEIVCHPGYADVQLSSAYNHQRETELHILTSSTVKNWIESRDVQLVSQKIFSNQQCSDHHKKEIHD